METIKELLAVGKQHFDNKQYQEAEDYLRRVIEQNPRYADVFNMMGVIAHVEGKFGSAIDAFEKALEINPRYTEAVLNLAVLYNDLGQYDKAKALYVQLRGRAGKGVTHIEPVLRGKLSNLHADIGDIYRSIGLYHHAVEEYRKALALNPIYFDIRTKLGQALREHGRMDDAISELKSVLRAKPNYSPALIQLGVTHYALDRIPDAKKAWKKVLEKDRENPYAKMYLRLCEAIAGAKKQVASPKARPARKPKATSKRRR
jgi:tetratricopeptide (TPR) repeat protein